MSALFGKNGGFKNATLYETLSHLSRVTKEQWRQKGDLRLNNGSASKVPSHKASPVPANKKSIIFLLSVSTQNF